MPQGRKNGVWLDFKVGQIGSNETNPGLFHIRFQNILARPISDLISVHFWPGFVTCIWDNLTHWWSQTWHMEQYSYEEKINSVNLTQGCPFRPKLVMISHKWKFLRSVVSTIWSNLDLTWHPWCYRPVITATRRLTSTNITQNQGEHKWTENWS